MSYRGFTWNLTASDAAHVARILALHQRCVECRRWDDQISDRLLKQLEIFMEVTPDGSTATHAHADS